MPLLATFVAVPLTAVGVTVFAQLVADGLLELRAVPCGEEAPGPRTSQPRPRGEGGGSAGARPPPGPLSAQASALLDRWSSTRCRDFFGGGLPAAAAAPPPTRSAYAARTRLWLPEGEVPAAGGERLTWPGEAATFSRRLTYEDIAVPDAYDPCAGPAVEHWGCMASVIRRHVDEWLDLGGPWDRWCMPYFIRTPIRSVKVATAAASAGQALLFVANWKVASTTLQSLLRSAPFLDFVGAHAMKSDGCEPGLGECCKHSTTSVGNLTAYRRIAFVRNPLDRFLSGVHEGGAWRARDMTSNLLAIRHAAARLRGFPHGHRACHHATQSYLLSATDARGAPLDFDFIGRVEDFESDWLAMGERLGLDLAPSVFARENPSGSAGTKAHIHAAVYAEEEEALCSVCSVYLQDYACFGYAVPRPCCQGRCSRYGFDLPGDRLRAAGCPEEVRSDEG